MQDNRAFVLGFICAALLGAMWAGCAFLIIHWG